MKAPASFVSKQRLHVIVCAFVFMSVSQLPHRAKYSVELSSHCFNFAMSNLYAGSALLHSLHLYRLCFHVCFGALLRRSGIFAEQSLHVAYFVIFLFLLHISMRPGSNAEHANVLRQTTHSTLAFSSVGRPPLTPCALPSMPDSAPLVDSTLQYSTLL